MTFPFVLLKERIEGCNPGVDLDRKKGEIFDGIVEDVGRVDEEWDWVSLSLTLEALAVPLPMALACDLVASSSLNYSFSSFLVFILSIALLAIFIIFGEDEMQTPTALLGILARWYFKQLCSLLISLPHNLHLTFCRL